MTTDENDGLKMLLWAFGIFFFLAFAVILIGDHYGWNKYYVEENSLRIS